MKRGLIILGALIFLSACSNEKKLDSFVSSYNDATYDYVAVDILKEKDFGPIEEDKYATTQTLYQLEGEQTLRAKYTDGVVTGYNMSISGDSPYENKTGTGYEASLVLIKALELDQILFENNYEQALDTGDIITYQDNGYKIILSDFVIGETHEGMTINIDKE